MLDAEEDGSVGLLGNVFVLRALDAEKDGWSVGRASVVLGKEFV